MKNTTRALLSASSLTGLISLGSFASAAVPPPAEPPAAANPAPAAPPEDTSPAHTSYLFGLTFGEQLHTVGVGDQVDQAEIERGIKDGLAGQKSTRADQQQIQTFVRTAMTQQVERNKEAAKDFLAKNGKEKGVKTTTDGLEYKVIAAGNPKAPLIQATDEVTVQYRGTLQNGTEFDSSYSRGTPATFRVNGVIKGWQEALVLMRPGSKYQLFVPPELAYDNSPRPGIPAGSLLIFDVEVVSVKPAEAPPAANAAPTPAPAPATKPAATP
jgi:FKBP-type peptidyl-prolyl cis-trans isomerase